MKTILAIRAGALLASPMLSGGMEFEEPQMIMADGKPIRVESPGFACPSLGDVDGDGKVELLVGQYVGGKIQVFERGEGLEFGKGTWLKAEGEVAEVPGVS